MMSDASPALRGNAGHAQLVRAINERFNALSGPLFATDASGLFEAYLDALPGHERQEYNCSCCRVFIERFGGLAQVDDDGLLVSAIWDGDTAPAAFRGVATTLARLVRQAGITMPFLSSEAMYGKPAAGGWHHFAIEPARVYRDSELENAWQHACSRREAFVSVRRALDEYSAPVCATALRLLKDDSLHNAEAALGQAQFLVDLHAARDAVHGEHCKDNLVYRMVALAPMGFCHPRTSMIATLLDDILAGKSFEAAAASWSAKMDGLQYMRPQALPTAGAIAAATEAFEKLGAASALERRFATMDDIQETIWLPRAPASPPAAGGIFASVTPKPASSQPASMTAPPVVMTLEKFRRTVLPDADRIEMAAPITKVLFTALTSAVHADARPIMQWDTPAQRNPVAWYVYSGGSDPQDFNLSGDFYEVTAITPLPHEWAGQSHPQHGKGLVLLLKGARDLSCKSSCIFPSCLKSELRAFRSTIEAYSQANDLSGSGEDNVAGMGLYQGGQCAVLLRVTSKGQVSDYRIDRWD
ncbi:hypothetical protein [Massilia aquatica]|uniref:Uncharacterized protein n=1 Tax=Massilia aquatica TaxID=2609000 RepID=A0ABX0MK88_9BURK|nr:hypothetical protein [Massilia aquatica]NHZ44702.1 hypothetical protein [Massilia aquatica]